MNFIKDLVSKDLIDSKMKSEMKEEKLKTEINCLVEIYKFGSEYWSNLLLEGQSKYLQNATNNSK